MAESMLRMHPENGHYDEHGATQESKEGNSGVMEEPYAIELNPFEEIVLRELSTLKKEISSRDILLQKLEESVTSLAEDFGPLKALVMSKMHGKQERERLQESASLEGGSQHVEPNTEDAARTRCIEAMMRMTDILENNDSKTSFVREIYEKIYDTAPLTSFILRYLQLHPEVKILFDCDSCSIHRLVKRIHNRDGVKQDSREVQAFADFQKLTVYMSNMPIKFNRNMDGDSNMSGISNKGGVSSRRGISTLDGVSAVGGVSIMGGASNMGRAAFGGALFGGASNMGGNPTQGGVSNMGGVSSARTGHPSSAFIMALAQTAMLLIFKNGGSPYSCDDDLNEKLYEEIILDAEKRRCVGGSVDDLLYLALDTKTSLGKEIELIAVVPGLLVKHGSKSGMKMLAEKLPWLLLYYKHNVLPKMMN